MSPLLTIVSCPSDDHDHHSMIMPQKKNNSSLSSTEGSLPGNQYILEAHLPFSREKGEHFLHLLARLKQLYDSSSFSSTSSSSMAYNSISDRYFFRSRSNEMPYRPPYPPYRFGPIRSEYYRDLYRFPANPYPSRSPSSVAGRYIFRRDHPPPLLIYPHRHGVLQVVSTTSPGDFSTSVTTPTNFLPKTSQSNRVETAMSTDSSPSSSYLCRARNQLENHRTSGKYISQYYAERESPNKTKDIHKRIMQSVNQSLIDRAYRWNDQQMKLFTQSVRRHLRRLENQSLERELDLNLIRCFSLSYLDDLRREDFRRKRRSSPYTYEDVQDLHISSQLDGYQLKRSMRRDHRRHSVSQISSWSQTEHLDPQSAGFETTQEPKSFTSLTGTPSIFREGVTMPGPEVDLFESIMRENFNEIDRLIAGRVSRAACEEKEIDIRSNSSFWSDSEEEDRTDDDTCASPRVTPNPRPITRYISTIHQSLLERPSDLIADYYIAQLNRNMQRSVQRVVNFARQRQRQRQCQRDPIFERSLSAEHLYRVRKEHIRYRESSSRPMSFTTEDIADIYKPFALESYKRKIAIEIERRRRNQPSSSLTEQRGVLVSRAQRTITDDGSMDVSYHLGENSAALPDQVPPSVRLTNAHDIHDRDHTTWISETQMILSSHRPQAKIYTRSNRADVIFLCQATRVQEEIEHQMLSNANIQTISTYHHPKTHSNESIDLTEHEETRPPSQHQGNVIQPRPEHQAYIQEETIIFEESIPLNISSLSVSKANESRDSGISLNQSQIYQHPTPLDPLEESYSSSDSDSSSYTPLRIQKEPPISEEEYSSAQSLPPEPLPTQVLTTIDNEAPYSPSMVHISVTRPLHAPDQHTFSSDHALLFSACTNEQQLETLSASFPPCQSLIIHDHEWIDEHLGVISNAFEPIQNIVEQLGEQWTVETDLDTISYHPIQARSTTTTTSTLTHPLSHCSPTSDYETDSLDKEYATTSDLIRTVTSSQAHSSTSTSTQPLIPIVYFLDALAVHPPSNSSVTQDILVTLGFGQDSSTMKATWINRSAGHIEQLPTSIHQETPPEILSTLINEDLQYAKEHVLEPEETALIIYPHRLQYGHDYGENIEPPLIPFYEPGYLHVPVINEVAMFQMDGMSIDRPVEFSSLSVIAEDAELFTSNDFQLKSKPTWALAQIEEVMHQDDYPQILPLNLLQPSYVDRYHIQSLHPMVELHSPPVIHGDETEKDQDDGQAATNRSIAVRPSVRPDVNRYEEDLVVDQSTIVHPPLDVSSGSDDEKSTSSEEVVFEEWSEEFRCRRIDEYDEKTKTLVRSSIQPTSVPIKGDVIKEEYKGKHRRAKRHRSADPYRSSEEVATSPPYPRYPSTTTLSSSSRPFEENYVTEIVHDRNLARTIESDASSSNQYDRLVTQVPKAMDQEDLISEEYQVEIEQIDQGENDEIRSSERDRQWRDELKERQKSISDDEQLQRKQTSKSPHQARFKEVQVKRPNGRKPPPSPSTSSSSPAQSPSTSRRAVKEVLVCVSRGSTPEKTLHSSSSSSSLIEKDEEKSSRASSAGFDTSPSPPPKRSSLIEERRATFESSSTSLTASKPDRITSSVRVGALKNAFETSPPASSPKDEYPTYSVPIVTGLTEQRRKLFEDQDGSNSNRYRKPMLDQQRFPSIDALKSTFEPTMSKITRPVDVNIQSKQTIASIDSDITRSSPPIHQSTPKWKYQVTDVGNESEDELSDSPQPKTPKTRLRDLSQSTPQIHQTMEKNTSNYYTPESGFYEQQTRSSTNLDETIPRTSYARPPPRHVSRKLVNTSPEHDYETLTNYRSFSQLPVVTQSRSRKATVVDEIETIETKTHVENHAQGIYQSSQKEEFLPSSVNSTTASSRRVLLNERPQYYESSPEQSPKIQPLHVTSFSPENQVTFGKSASNEVIAIVRIPERATDSAQFHSNPTEHKTLHSSSLAFPLRTTSHDRIPSKLTRHSGSLDNLLNSNFDFQIQVEKRPPYQPEQPTVVSLDQCTRAIVTTSKDGRVSIQNVAARPGNTLVIHSDFHSSDRSSGYFSSDDLRSNPLTTQDSSDEQSTLSRPRRYRNNPTQFSQLPSYYRTKRPADHVDQVNELIHRQYPSPSSTANRTGFNETIDQIDALYNKLDVREKDNTPYDFSKSSTSTINRRRELVQNPTEYSQRYTSTGFQHIPSPPPTSSTYEHERERPVRDYESGTIPAVSHPRHWSSSSLTDLVMTSSFPRTSQSLSSSGILADYPTPGTISPTSAFGSTPDILHQQSSRNMSPKKNQTRKYSDDDEEHDSPLSDNERTNFRSHYP